MTEWIKRYSSTIAVLCNVAVVVIVIGFAICLFLRPKPQPLADLRIGSSLPLTAIDSRGAPNTVVIVLSAQCSTCEEEADHYRQIEQEFGRQYGVVVSYLMPENEIDGRKFLARHGLTGGARFAPEFRSAGINVFPSVLLVDRRGVVRFSHCGPLSPVELRKLKAVTDSKERE